MPSKLQPLHSGNMNNEYEMWLLLLLFMWQRLEADYRNHEQTKASLVEQRRQLNNFLLVHRRRRHRRHQHDDNDDNDDDDDDEAAFSGVVVVKETGTCSGHVTNITQRLDDMDETASNSDSGTSSLVMSTSSDNGLDSFSYHYLHVRVYLILLYCRVSNWDFCR